MCQGRKKWRIMLPHDFTKHHAELSLLATTNHQNDEKLVNGKWIMSNIKRPFETWNASTSPLESLDVVIYEGILEPNEILYIPPGAPHAATTLDHSLMVASNDQSMQSLHEIIQYCDQDNSRNQWHGCSHFRDRYLTISENYNLHNHANDLARESMSFGKSFQCEEAFSQLAEPRLEITPLNFEEEVQNRGPILIMKYVRSCISCLRYLTMLQNSDLDTPVRLGVLNCPDGTCPPGESKEYQKILPMIRSTCPEFVLVYPSDYYKTAIPGVIGSNLDSDHDSHENNEREEEQMTDIQMTVIHYYGPLHIDFLKVWIGLKTGSKVDISPCWYKTFIVACHMMNGMTVAYLQGRGIPPMADDAIAMSVVLLLFFFISTCIILCGTLRTNKSSQKKQKTR
uniref:JmjC domain-containing protein n=1 Tax=Attheya septentrionalis TaxID=420275 RepID=A0A7S2XUT3_9STRA